MRVIRDSNPVAKKPNWCDWCHTRIEPGTRYRNLFIIGDDGPYTWAECTDCAPPVGPAYDWAGGIWSDGISEDDMAEWAREHLADEIWGAQAAAFLARRFPEKPCCSCGHLESETPDD